MLHGGGGVQDEGHGDPRIDVAFAEEEAVGAGEQLPIDLAGFVAGLIGAVLAEIAGAARVQAGVESGHGAGDEPSGAERQLRGGGEQRRVERRRGRRVHGLTGSGGGGREAISSRTT
jgi:hypothetical protein